ncbi:hypothetical protein ACQ86N_14265 [Puia sp. P3]|uniref:hypothetical protein n=1 Tax=Puia sp. P3 TaxID=3423952 RepID=UPI003D67A879
MLFRQLLILLTVLTATTLQTRGQINGCSTLGQTPGTAFPVCGISTFKQDSVPPCPGARIPVPCSDNAQYSDINPFWYKFTCYTSGTLGFLITPTTSSDDYDWQIFDVTGHDPNDVYTQSSLFVSGNWSSNSAGTGTSDNKNGSINCAGPAYPNMNSMPNIIQGITICCSSAILPILTRAATRWFFREERAALPTRSIRCRSPRRRSASAARSTWRSTKK